MIYQTNVSDFFLVPISRDRQIINVSLVLMPKKKQV